MKTNKSSVSKEEKEEMMEVDGEEPAETANKPLQDDEANLDEQPTTTVRSTTCMECNGSIQARMMLQPSSLDSEIHARMSLQIAEKFKKEKK